jgi:HSP20 family molecular chaperone IbpA
MTSLFSTLLDDVWYLSQEPYFKPRVLSYSSADYKEKDDEIIYSIDVPGVKKEDLKASITDGILTISGCRDGTDFKKTFVLPKSAKGTKDPVMYLESGVLTIIFKKVGTETLNIEIK